MQSTVADTKGQEQAAWFDNLIATIRAHELQLETNTAPKEMAEFYSSLISNDANELFKIQKALVQKYFVSRILVDYIKHLGGNIPKKLAFDYNDSEVLVWAEIESDNEELEKHLILAAAQVNAVYHNYGFYMESMIVEDDDKLPIPKHYQVVKA